MYTCVHILIPNNDQCMYTCVHILIPTNDQCMYTCVHILIPILIWIKENTDIKH